MSSRKQSFVKGAAVLAIAGIISKILGAIYKIPLGNIIGSEGMAYYQTAYDLYVWALTIAAYSIPIAISKLVSERIELGRRAEAHKVFKAAIALVGLVGIIISVSLFIFAQPLAAMLKNPGAYIAVLCVAPAIFTVSLSGAFRGYFQGMQNMVPSGISQVIEQLARIISGFILAIFLLPMGYRVAAGGAVFGTSIAGIAGFLTLYFIYRSKKREIMDGIKASHCTRTESRRKIMWKIIAFSVPITLGSSIMPVMNLADTFIVMGRLQVAGYTYKAAAELFGQMKGMAGSFINLPQVFTIALGASLVPAISESIARNDYAMARKKSEIGLRLSLLIGLPAAMGLFVLANPIMMLMYPRESGTLGLALMYLAPAVIFLTLVQTMTAILQGMGKETIPVINMVIGAGAKIVLSYTLTAIPWLNVRGAAIGTVIGYAISAMLNLSAILWCQRMTIRSFFSITLKPVIATAVMMFVAYASYKFAFMYTMKNSIATLIAMMLAAMTYIIVLFIIKGITTEELEMTSSGRKLSTILKKKGWIQ